MPKIIENLKEKLLLEARRQVEEFGYAKTTIRSIASACGVGTGTVYNYFPSKDMLIASFMVEDWKGCLAEMSSCEDKDPESFLKNVCGCLERFIKLHSRLFYDKDAAASFSLAFSARHAQLRSQISGVIAPVCSGIGRDDLFFREFAAEALLSWTSEGKSFEELWSVIGRLFV